MARKQTRKSISVKGITGQRLKNYAESLGKSVSGVLEEIIAAKLDAENVPIPTKIDPPARKTPPEIISQHFTF